MPARPQASAANHGTMPTTRWPAASSTVPARSQPRTRGAGNSPTAPERIARSTVDLDPHPTGLLPLDPAQHLGSSVLGQFDDLHCSLL
ncbi:hypothetical protein [Allokutzneria oryzae]|uniref:Uncharacterized protein n=1 Tax=Allokutzneria oryzae TaxID=1378989 RepID=A0ABV5ZSW9_9PSEU